MKLISILLLAAATTAASAEVNATPLQKAPFDTKKPLYISSDGSYACPSGFDLYIRALAPPKKEKEVTPQGDYESFYFAKSQNPSSPAIVVSRPGVQEYVPACLQVK